jgi:hypothetical protein
MLSVLCDPRRFSCSLGKYELQRCVTANVASVGENGIDLWWYEVVIGHWDCEIIMSENHALSKPLH